MVKQIQRFHREPIINVIIGLKMTNLKDVIIIGGGPGGYVSAIRASQLGLNVTLIENKELGGICLNWGCIPTKSLLKVSEFKKNLDKFKEFGFNISGEITFDIEKIVKRSRDASKQLSSGVKFLLKKNKVEVIKGFASISSIAEFIEINITKDNGKNEKLETKNLVIATGAIPKSLPGIENESDRIWTAKEAMIPKKLPKSLTIIGSGAIGIEFASFYNDMGSKVTVIEAEKNIMPNEDEEISELAKSIFTKKGIKFFNNAQLQTIDLTKNNAISKFKIDNKIHEIVSENVLVAIGVKGNISNLGIEKFSIKTENGHIVTNNKMETNIKNIYAIGDVTSPPWLAHKASHEGVIVAEIIAGHQENHELKKEVIPGCTYSNPQIASIGLTEKQAKQKDIKLKIGKFPFLANGKSITIGDTEGIVKTIFNKETGELIGAHLIGSDVTELINSLSVAKSLETTEIELMKTVFAHPTLSETLHESVLSAYDKAIHI